jgi:hypothetical protein
VKIEINSEVRIDHGALGVVDFGLGCSCSETEYIHPSRTFQPKIVIYVTFLEDSQPVSLWDIHSMVSSGPVDVITVHDIISSVTYSVLL